ncbi:tetratricopeptide repeat protein [Streptomyces sp. NPDC020298]|uniref:tetratricopeptide repeat protein n=1 Tax=unclassified Streptomyces TaxID=2593676 RepID=UPI0033EFF415
MGRSDALAAFRGNFDLSPTDARHRFLFHVHGIAGVGKSALVREFEGIARQRGALTAYVNETVSSVPELLEEICDQFGAQRRRLKKLDRRLAAYRKLRHETEVALAGTGPEAEGPSPAAMTAARAALAALELVPGVSPLAGAVDPQEAGRLLAGVSARLRNQDDVRLVTAPVRELTPLLLRELAAVPSSVPWIVLFLDTYERTGPLLDGWLHEVMTTHRYGEVPENVVVVTCGQLPLDAARWGGFANSRADLPLRPFTEAETRELLAGRGVVAEPVVAEVLRLSDGLPLYVSTLAEQRHADVGDIDDPCSTVVERFLRWERDPAHRKAALACALPRGLNLDVFQETVDCPRDEAENLFDWLRGLSFVTDRGNRLTYHDLVRGMMLRRQRGRSRRGWAEDHERLAGVFGRGRQEAAVGLRPYSHWSHKPWREARLEETYHLLCARPDGALAGALRDLVGVCAADLAAGRRWAQMLTEAGRDTDAPVLLDWGTRLHEALANDTSGVTEALGLLLADTTGLDRTGRALAHTLRGVELARAGGHEAALAEYDRATELEPEFAPAYYNRGLAHQRLGDFPASVAAFDRANELVPDSSRILAGRGKTHWRAGRFEEAIADCDRAIALDPTDSASLAYRAVCRHALGRYDEALADFDRALSLDEDETWTLVRRSRLRRVRGEWDDAFADLDRAVRLLPDAAWVASERGDAYRLAGRYEEAVTELGRAVSLTPDYSSALASRGVSYYNLGRSEEALADLARAVESAPRYAWALGWLARVKRRLGDQQGMLEALRRAAEAAPGIDWIGVELGEACLEKHLYGEAIAAFRGVLERHTDHGGAWSGLGAAYYARGADREALFCLDRALEVNPDDGLAHGRRARVFLATGQTGRALADLGRYAALERRSEWARTEFIEVLMRCGRWDQASAGLALADRSARAGGGWDALRAKAHRHAGRWASARSIAERLRATDPVTGTLHLALAVGGSRGLEAARPLWRELARLVEPGAAEVNEGALRWCVASCALDDRHEGERALHAFLASNPTWDELADAALYLTELLHSPGADRSYLTERLATITEARDALQARYAE